MSSYSYEQVVQASRDAIITLVSDPFLFAGVMGHIAILQVYDEKSKDFVTPSSLSKPSNKFKVTYIFGTPENKVYTSLGEMEGPLLSVQGVSYKGFAYDNSVKWSVDILARPAKGSETLVRILVSADYERSFFSRLLGRPQFDLAEHIVKDHILPYMRFYFKPSRAEVPELTPTLVFSEEGPIASLIPKLFRASKDVEYGLAVIEGKEVRGEIFVKNGKAEKVDLTYNGQAINDSNGLLQLLTVESPAKITLYTVSADTAIMAALEKAVSKPIGNLIGRE